MRLRKVKAYMPKAYKSKISMGVAKQAGKKLIKPGRNLLKKNKTKKDWMKTSKRDWIKG